MRAAAAGLLIAAAAARSAAAALPPPEVVSALRAAPVAQAASDTREVPLPPSGRLTDSPSAPTGARHLLVSLRRHGHAEPLARALRSSGHDARELPGLAVLAVRTAERGLAARLRADRRVAAVERDRLRALSAEPAEEIDPATGFPYAWHLAEIRADEALAAVGGGSKRVIAVLDSGLDVGHPDLAPGVVRATYDAVEDDESVDDTVGHGTFVAGLIAAGADNGIGTRGAGGTTPIVAVKVAADAGVRVSDVVRGLLAAIVLDADIVNLSLSGENLTEAETRAVLLANLSGVFAIAAAGNRGREGSRVEHPAALLDAGEIGLSVGATRPDGTAAPFSTHNPLVSLAAPGGGAGAACSAGVWSLVPRNATTLFDPAPAGCAPPTAPADGTTARWSYSEGTSFATPLVAAMTALAWQAEPRLTSNQLYRLMTRSARGEGRNDFTGFGVVDGAAAVAYAKRFDLTPPRARIRAKRVSRAKVAISLSRGKDRTTAGRELAGGVTYAAVKVTPRGFTTIAVTSRPLKQTVALSKREQLVLNACDAAQNCAGRTVTLRG